MSINDVQVEQRVIVARMVLHIQGGEFLIGGHQGRGDIVCQEIRLSVRM